MSVLTWNTHQAHGEVRKASAEQHVGPTGIPQICKLSLSHLRRQNGHLCECDLPFQVRIPRHKWVTDLRVSTKLLPNKAPSLAPSSPASPPP